MSIGPASFGYDLLPATPGVPPDIALDAAVAPVVDDTTEEVVPYGKGWSFDFLAGQFRRRGTLPQEAYDLDNFIVWAEKNLRTARRTHPVYDDFGMEYPVRLIGETVDAEDLADYAEAVTEALLVHDRVIAVEDFTFNQQADDEALYANFTVILDSAGPLNPQSLEFTDIPIGWPV